MRITTSLTLAAIFFLTFWFKGTELFCMADWSLMNEYAYRFAVGQRPYVDFGLVLAPGSFWMQSLLISIFGLSYPAQNLFVLFEGVLAIFLVGWSLQSLEIKQRNYLLLLAPLTLLSLGSVSRTVDYDYDSALLALTSITLFLFSMKQKKPLPFFISGLLASLTFFFKQSTGAGYMCAYLIVCALNYFFAEFEAKFLRAAFLGLISGLLLSLALVASMTGLSDLDKFYQWTFLYAAETRSGGLRRIVFSFLRPQILLAILPWMAAWALQKYSASQNESRQRLLKILCGFFLIIPFTLPIAFWIRQDFHLIMIQMGSLWIISILLGSAVHLSQLLVTRKISLAASIFLLSLGFVLSAFASHGAVGSNHGTWPFFILVWSSIFLSLSETAFTVFSKSQLLRIFSAGMLLAGFSYAFSNTFMKMTVPYQYSSEAASLPSLSGLKTSGPWVNNFEKMIAWTEVNIPKTESLVALPGEDPFYAVTGRTPQLQLFLLIPGGFPFTLESHFESIRKNKIQWLIVKTNLQLPNSFLNVSTQLLALGDQYQLIQKLDGYEIYRIKESHE